MRRVLYLHACPRVVVAAEEAGQAVDQENVLQDHAKRAVRRVARGSGAGHAGEKNEKNHKTGVGKLVCSEGSRNKYRG